MHLLGLWAMVYVTFYGNKQVIPHGERGRVVFYFIHIFKVPHIILVESLTVIP